MTIEKNKEKVEELKKDDKIKLKTDFLKDFVSSKLKEKNPNDFIINTMKWDSITEVSWLKSDLEKYKAYIEKYNSIDLADINIFDIKVYLSKDFFELESFRKNLQKEILWNYNISENEYNTIQTKLNLLNPLQIKEYLKNEENLKKYLSSLSWRQIDKKSNFDFLSLSKNEVENRLSKLKNDEDKQEVKRILFDLDRLVIRDYDIRTLCEFDFLNKNEQKQLIKSFIPFLNLKEALEIWFINESEAKKERKKALEYVLSKYNFSDNDLDSISQEINDKDIFISTNGFDTKILSDKIGFSFLEESFSSIKQEAEEEFKKTWPQSLETLIKELKALENANARFLNLAKFKKDNLIKFSSKKVSWEEEISYLKIIDTDDTKKELSFIVIWEWKTINLKVSSESNDISYKEFFQKIQNSSSKMEFFTKKEIEDKLKNPENTDFIKSELELFEAQDLKDPDKTNEYIDFYKQNLQKEIDELEDEFVGKGWKEEENPLLVEQIKYKKEELEQLEIWKANPSTSELLWFLNKQKLIEKLDELDPDGKKLGFKKWLFLETKEWWTHEVTWIDYEDWKIFISSNINWKIVNEEMNFELFFASFKEHEAKRIQKITDFKDFVDIFKITNKDSWGDYAFENGNFIAKDVEHKDKKQDLPVEYLVSDKEDNIIKIENISGDKITVAFWERKNAWDLDKKDKNYKKDSEQEILFIKWAPSHTYSLNEFKKIIEDKKYNFKPDWKTWRKDIQIQAKNEQNDRHNSFVTRLFSNKSSIVEMIAAWKMFVNNIIETLKRWNDLHSARIALKFASILPEEIRAEFLIKVESEENESMEKALKWLWSVDSPIATKRILSWLLNRDTPEHKKEAWMLFMLSKYGFLCTKWAFMPYKNKFLWYEAFGWRIWDTLYKKIENEAKEKWLPFTEEKLIEALITDQCKFNTYSSIKRRSRLYKELQWKIWAWYEKDRWDGEKAAEWQRLYKDKINMAYWEASGWTFANAFWVYKNSLKSAPNLEDMSEFPFAILFSWVSKSFNETSLNDFKSIIWEYWPVIISRFLTNTWDMDLFSKTVLELSKRYTEIYWWEYSDMYSEAKTIFDNQNNFNEKENWKPLDKVARARRFWNKYNKTLTKSLHLLHNQDDTTSKTDKIILLEKNNNSIFNSYFNTIQSFVKEESVFKEDIIDWYFRNIWTSGLSYKVLVSLWELNPDSTFRKERWRWIFSEIIQEIKTIKNKHFVWPNIDSIENRKAQLELLKRPLSFLRAYYQSRSWHSPTVDLIKKWKSDLWIGYKSIWLTSEYLDEIASCRNYDLLSGNHDDLLEKIAKDILSNNSWNQNNSVNNSNYKNPFKDTIDDVKWDIDDTIAT